MAARPLEPGPRESETYAPPPPKPAPPLVLPQNAVLQQPPERIPPTSFAIGDQQTDGPLVTIPRIKGHLALLNAFAKLKQEVMECKDEIPRMPANAEKRWAWFVNLSVERFDQWAGALTQLALEQDLRLPMEVILPPIDILMVWHSYMLNPRWYAEDSERIPRVKALYTLGNHCMKSMPYFVDILASPPTEARTDHFTNRLAIPFDPLTSASWHSTGKAITCPYCSNELSVQYMQDDGTGYFQNGFEVTCPRLDCGKRITKQHLRARKFAEHIVEHQGGPSGSLPGIAKYTSHPERDAKINSRIRNRFLESDHVRNAPVVPGTDGELCRKILEDCNYSLPKMRAKAGRSPARALMMSAHLEPLAYSVELAGAVLRQGSFVNKMHGFGWTQPGYFDAPEDELALQHALARYHAFLDLLSSSPTNFFVPTLDIDLVWHTHQLFASQYKTHCETYVGRFINHDDKVDTFKLSDAFENTCKAWKDRFGIQYTHCGCPSVGDSIGKRLTRFVASKKSSEPASSPLGPPPPDTSTVEFRAATHASEHNGVIFTPLNNGSRWDVKERWRRHEGISKNRVEREAKERGRKKVGEYQWRTHGVAFLYPVPFFHPPSVPEGCVASNASVVNPAGACGNGHGVCGGGGCSAGGCGSAGCNSVGFSFDGPDAACASCGSGGK